MANNVANYIKNLGKSVMYSAVDIVKDDIAPSTVDFVDVNKDLFKEIYAATKDMRKTMNRAKTSIRNSKVYAAAEVGWTALQEDLRTGKFYNKERQDEMYLRAMGETGDMDIGGFEGFDDNDVSFDDEDTDDWGSLSDIGKGDIHISTSVEKSAEMSSKVISDTVARTGKYIADTQKANTHMLYMQNLSVLSGLKTGFGDLHNSMSSIFKVNEAMLQSHNENTLKYYDTTTKLMQEQNAMLKQLVEAQTKLYAPKENKTQSNAMTFSDVASGGVLNIQEYAKLVKKNIKGKSGSLMDMLIGGDNNMLLAFTANPLKFISDFVAASLIPAAVKTSAKSFDESFSGLFAGLMSRLNYRASKDDEGGIFKMLNDIFGVRNTVNKAGVDVSKYEKGAIPFDGLTKKTIVDVIPGYLRKIESLLSGKAERVFNYESGKWQTSREIKVTFDRQEDSAIRDAFSDIMPEIEAYMNRVKISEKQDRDELMKGISDIARSVFENGGYYDPYAEDYDFDKDDKSPEAVFNAMWKEMAKSNTNRKKLNLLPKRVYEAIESLNRQRSNLDGYSIFRELNLNSGIDDTVKRNKDNPDIIESSTGLLGSPLSVADNFGHNVYYYLQNMYRELYYIRSLNGAKKGAKIDIPAEVAKLGDPITKMNLPKTELQRREEQKRREAERYEKSEEKRAQSAAAKGNTLGNFDEQGADAVRKATEVNNLLKDNEELKKNQSSVSKAIDKWIQDSPDLIYNHDGTKKSFLDALLEAGTLGDKFKVISASISELTKRPGDMLAGIITTADQKVYELIYGSEQKDSKGRPIKGFLDALINRMELTFDKFNIWLDENILKRIKNSEVVEKAKNFARPYGEAIKDVFGSAWNYTKSSVKDVYSPLWNKGKELLGVDTAGEIQTNYGGRLITESGLTAISKGEMIIPSELNPLNPDRSRTNKRKERSTEMAIVRKAKAAGLGDIGMYADGTPSVGTKQGKKNDLTFSNMMYSLFGDENTNRQQFAKSTEVSLSKIKQYAPETVATGLLGSGIGLLTGAIGGPLIGAATGAAIGLAKQSKTFQSILFGEEVTDEQGNTSRQGGIISKKVQDFFKSDKFKDLAKFGVTGAVTGLFTPLGPVGGLIMGSAISYAKNNAKISEALFGDVDGLFNKDRKDAIKKAFPKMAAGAAAGILLGPFGLVGNAMLGSATSFVVTSDKFKELLFGVEDEDGEYRGGLLGGIREHIINPLKNFGKDFAKKAEEFVVNDLIKPITGAVDPIIEEIKYGVKNIFMTIPKMIDKLFNNVLGIPLSSFINEKFIEPAAKLLGGTFKALINPAKFIISAPSKLIGGIGNMYRMKQIRQGRANYMTAEERLQFREEHGKRNLLSKLHIPGAAGLLGGPMFDSYAATDEAMVGMDDESINAVRELLGTASNSNKYYEKQVVKERNKVGSEVDRLFNDKRFSFIDNNARTRILRAINKGDVETVKVLIGNLKTRKGKQLTEEQRNEFYEKLAPLSDKLLDTRSRRNATREIEDETFAELRNKYGLTKLNKKNLSKYIDLFDKESKARKSIEKSPELVIADEQKNTTEAVNEQTKAFISMLNRTNTILEYIQKGSKGELPKDDSGNVITKLRGIDVKDLGITKFIDKIKPPVDFTKADGTKEEIHDNDPYYSVFSKFGPKETTEEGTESTTETTTETQPKKKSLFSRIGDKFKSIRDKIKVVSTDGSGDADHSKDAVEEQKNQSLFGKIGDRVKSIRDKAKVSTDGSDDADHSKDAVEEEQEKQKQQSVFSNISEKITLMANTMSSYLMFWKKDKEDEEKEPWWKKAFNWLGKTAGFLTILGFVPKIYNWLKDSFMPAAKNVYEVNIKPWLDTNILPIISPMKGIFEDIKYTILGVKDYLTGTGLYETSGGLRGDIKGIFSNVVIPWFAGESPFNRELDGLKGGLPGTLRYVSKHWLGGIEVITKYGAQALLTGITTFLPAIAKGLIKGIGGFLKNETNKMLGLRSTEDLSYLDNASASLDMSKEMPELYPQNAGVKWASKILTYTDQFGVSTTYNDRDAGVNAALEAERQEAEASGDIEAASKVNDKIAKYNQNAARIAELRANGEPTSIRDKGELGQLLKEQEDIINKTPGLMLNEDGTTTIFDQEAYDKANNVVNKTKMFALDDKESLGETLAGTLVRSTLTGRKISGLVQKAFSATNSIISKIPVIGKISGAIFDVAGKGYNNIIEKTAKETAATTAVKKTVSGVSEALIKKFKGIVESLLTKIFNSSIVQRTFANGMVTGLEKLTKEAFEKATKTCIGRIVEALAKALSKASAKVVAKVTAFIGTGGAISIVFAAADFLSGFNNANTIMGVTEASFGEKLICGLLKAVNGIITLGLVPEELIMTIFTDTILPLFGIDNEKLEQRRQAALQEAHDAGYDTLEDYNDSQKWTTKLKNVVSGAWEGLTSAFKNANDVYQDAMDAAYNPIAAKEAANNKTYNVKSGSNTISYSARGKGRFGRGNGHLSQLDSSYNMRFNVPGDSYAQYMSDSGCGPVAAATVVNGLYGKGLDPKTAAQYALDNGYKEVNGGTVPAYFGSIFGEYGINSRYETSGKGIVNALKSGRQVVMMGSGGGNTPYGENPHYVVATGLDENGNLIIEDPGSRRGALKYNKNNVFNKTSVAISAGLGKVRNAIGSGEFPDIAFQDLGKFSKLSAADINAWIKRVRPDSPFVGNGNVFIRASEESGLDPRYIVAHAATESAWGTSKIARDKGNYFGIAAYNSSPYQSALKMGSTLFEGIVAGAKWIKKNYYNKGQKTLYGMIYGNPSHRYAVYNNGQPNDQWVKTIASIMKGAPKNSNPSLIDTDTASSVVNSTVDTATTTTTTETKKTPGLFDHLDSISNSLNTKLESFNEGFDLLDKTTKSFFGPLYEALYGKEEEVTTTTTTTDSSTTTTSASVPATSKLTDFFLQSLPGSRISSYYNQDRTSGWPNDIHHGTDFAVSKGTPVMSPVNGTVTQSIRTSGTYADGYGAAGESIKITDDYGYIHCFFHLSERRVKQGDRVKRGDIIGLVGSTGNSSGPHLHYELRSPTTGTHMSPADYPYSLSTGVSARGKLGLGKQPMTKLNYVDTSIKQYQPQQQQVGAAGTDYSKFLATIVEILITISKNSDQLSQIVKLLSEYMDIKDIDTSSINANNSEATAQKLATAIIQQQAANNRTAGSSAFGSDLKNKDIQYIMAAMNSIATE